MGLYRYRVAGIRRVLDQRPLGRQSRRGVGWLRPRRAAQTLLVLCATLLVGWVVAAAAMAYTGTSDGTAAGTGCPEAGPCPDHQFNWLIHFAQRDADLPSLRVIQAYRQRLIQAIRQRPNFLRSPTPVFATNPLPYVTADCETTCSSGAREYSDHGYITVSRNGSVIARSPTGDVNEPNAPLKATLSSLAPGDLVTLYVSEYNIDTNQEGPIEPVASVTYQPGPQITDVDCRGMRVAGSTGSDSSSIRLDIVHETGQPGSWYPHQASIANGTFVGTMPGVDVFMGEIREPTFLAFATGVHDIASSVGTIEVANTATQFNTKNFCLSFSRLAASLSARPRSVGRKGSVAFTVRITNTTNMVVRPHFNLASSGRMLFSRPSRGSGSAALTCHAPGLNLTCTSRQALAPGATSVMLVRGRVPSTPGRVKVYLSAGGVGTSRLSNGYGGFGKSKIVTLRVR